jgi:hypothetical protein
MTQKVKNQQRFATFLFMPLYASVFSCRAPILSCEHMFERKGGLAWALIRTFVRIAKMAENGTFCQYLCGTRF